MAGQGMGAAALAQGVSLHAEVRRMANLGPGHRRGLATLGSGHGSGGSPPTITTTYTYDDADELTRWTTSTVTMSFSYASDGCLVNKSDGTDTWTYDWDYERRLEAFKKNSATLVEYTYNPTGTRRSASDATLGVENYFYHGPNVIGDYASNWSLKTSFVRLPQCLEIVRMLDRTADPTLIYYFTKDGQMSTRELLNSSENVVTRYSYDAWGDPSESQLLGNISVRMLFASLERCEQAQLYFDAFGSYASEIARTLRGVALHSPTKLIDCKANEADDYWWWNCVDSGGGCGTCKSCCARNYEACMDDCPTIFMEHSSLLAPTADAPEYLGLRAGHGRVGDPIPGIETPNFGCHRRCWQKDHTCRHWCEDEDDYEDGYYVDRDCYKKDWREGHFDIYNWYTSFGGVAYVCCAYNSNIKSPGAFAKYPFACYDMYNYCDPFIGDPKYWVGAYPPFSRGDGRNARVYCDLRNRDWLAPDDY